MLSTNESETDCVAGGAGPRLVDQTFAALEHCTLQQAKNWLLTPLC
ncbi:hypothetical protein [Streptomyces zhihengii]